jgi:ribosomal protein S18 acetylase RimI-like enzyme
VDLAKFQDQTVGYLISAMTVDGLGEIESIFIIPWIRGQAIGDELMQRVLHWLDKQQVHTKRISVVMGNERAYPFFARFGFYPRVVMLYKRIRRDN